MAEGKREVWVVEEPDGTPLSAHVFSGDAIEYRPADSVRYTPAEAGKESGQAWVDLARWCSVHAKERRIGCNEYATGRWKVWAEWNDDAIESGSGPTADAAAVDLCDKLATRHPSSALPPPSKPEGDRNG